MSRKLALAAILLLLSPDARARDLSRQPYLLGERASGMGGAFVSLVGDPASTYYNPAGLGGLFEHGISLSASVYQLSMETYESIMNLKTEEGGTIAADMDSSTFATFPSSMIYLLPLDENKEPEAFHHVVAFSVLVPDHDKTLAVIDKPGGEYAFELKATWLSEEMTYWVGPSYAVAMGGRLRIGLSLFLLAHMSETRAKLGSKVAWEDEDGYLHHDYDTTSMERSALGVTMLAQAGVQYDLTDRLSLGLTLRSPTFGPMYSQLSMLEFGSNHQDLIDYQQGAIVAETGYVDRIETDEGEVNYQLPLMVAAGASYSVPGSFTVALDASFHLAQGPFYLFAGQQVYPLDPMDNELQDDERALWVDRERKSSTVFNVNLGMEVAVKEDLLARLGLFTDLSAVDQDFYDTEDRRSDAVILPSMNRFGISLGAGMLGEKSTTSFGLVYVAGVGETFSLTEEGAKVDVTTHTITAVLAGSADL